LAKGNDIWALVAAMITSLDDTKMEQYLVKGIPIEIQDVIYDHADLFVAPNSLPPSRMFDRAISLQPGCIPVNNRPYRNSSQQKDEIEKQTAVMLMVGTVVASLSLFASPVLLVKNDGT
jgi:hypothetical protein